VGNRTLQTIDGVPEAATFDANDRILTQYGATYSYDREADARPRARARSRDEARAAREAGSASRKIRREWRGGRDSNPPADPVFPNVFS